MANIPELDRVLAYIKDHPEKHDQSTWVCGTTACFAGHTALLNGWKEVVEMTCTVEKDGKLRSVPLVAADILDLDPDQVDTLFFSASDLEDVEVVVKAIANNEDTGYALQKFWDGE